jgi:DNA-directed RNA polymerase subunit omega
MKLIEGFDSNYRYVLVAARRARQIQNGARPVLEPHSRKPCRIAEEEIQAGKVKWEIPPAAIAASMDASTEMQDGRVGGDADD